MKEAPDTRVKIDLQRFQQIITNLLTNALAAIPKEDGRIDVRLKQSEEKVFLWVEDNGKGISEKDKPFIFERFFRGENKKYKNRGLGIGLAFSKMLAHAMEGDLTLLESRPGRTVFCVCLPKSKGGSGS
ncbi:sensor histidine kinase [Paludifilum halophilum]|uniref:sensor histidine kinase n=1 Tax=Paludifilum halophilum TaxID=1642702 RepID=UPI00146F7C19|nr:ATP-binding protein [Paludifilum halophilum]